jgi:hypothetical protein
MAAINGSEREYDGAFIASFLQLMMRDVAIK